MAKRKNKLQEGQLTYAQYKRENGTEQTYREYKSQPKQNYAMNAVNGISSWLQNLYKRAEDYKVRQQQEHSAATKYWQDKTNEYKYSGNGDESWRVYAAKQMSDTRGAVQREKEREEKKRQEQENLLKQYQDAANKYWQDMSQNARNAGTPENAYAYKMINDTPLTKEQKEKNGDLTKQKKFLEYISRTPQYIQQQKDRKRAQELLGYEGAKSYQKDGGRFAWTIDQQKALNAEKAGLVEKGAYDDFTYDPKLVSDQGLAAWTEGKKKERENLLAGAEQLNKDYFNEAPNQKMGSVFDFVESWDEENENRILNNGNYGDAEKQNAQDTLDELKRTAEQRRADMVLWGQTVFNDNTYRNQWEGLPQEEQREYLYNSLMGDNYEDRMEMLNPVERKQLNNLLDGVIASARPYNPDESDVAKGYNPDEFDVAEDYNPDEFDVAEGYNPDEFDVAEDYKGLNVAADSAYNARLAGIQEQRERETQRDSEKRMEQYGYDGTYKPELAPEVKYYNTEEYGIVSEPEPQGTEVDKAYYWMNNTNALNGEENLPQHVKKWYFATPEMVEYFNKCYEYDKEHPGGYGMAKIYLERIDQYLNQALFDYKTNYNKALAEKPVEGAIARLASPLLNAAGGLISATGTALAAMGVKDAQNKNSDWYTLTKMVQDVRSQQNANADAWVAENVHPWFEGRTQFLLNTVDSMADNIVAMAAGGGLGNAMYGAGTKASRDVAMRTIQLIMSGEATGNRMIEKLDEGMNPTEAAVYAIGDGVIEWITERVSLEALLDPNMKEILGNPARRVAYFAKVGIAEGSEEIAADVLNMGLDALMSEINGHETELEANYRNLVNGGMSGSEAAKQVLRDKLNQIGMSGLAGMISGIGLGAAHYVGNRITQGQIGTSIKNSNNILNTEITDMIETARMLGEESMSAQQAEKIAADLEAGKKVSNRSLGKLAQTMQTEAAEQFTQAESETARQAVVEELQENGVKEGAEQLADIIMKARTEGKLTRAEREILLQNETAYQTLQNLYKRESKLAKKIRTNPKVQSLSDTLTATQNIIKGNTSEGYSAEDVGQHLASEEDYRQAEGEKQSGADTVIVDHKYGKLDGMELVESEDAEGRKQSQWKYRVMYEGESRPQYVDAGAIKATDFKTAAVIHLRETSPAVYGGNYVNTILKQIQEGNVSRIGQYMEDAERIRWNAFLQRAMPETRIREDAAKELYRISQEDAVTEWKEDSKKQKGKGYKGAGHGTARYGSAVYGTEDFDKAVDAIKDEKLRARVKSIAQFAQDSGIDVQFVDLSTEEGKKQYGSFADGTISLNLSGQNYGIDEKGQLAERGQHDIIVTLGHEMTHWLRSNNEAGFIRLRDFVLGKLASEPGVSLVERAQRKMAINSEAGNNITMTAAIEEIVADACDQVLGNPETKEYLEKNDTKLFSAVKGFVKNLVSRFEKWSNEMKGSASREARAMMKYANELSRIWLGAYNEVLTGKVQEAEEQAETKEKAPVRMSAAEETVQERKTRLVAENSELINAINDIEQEGPFWPWQIRTIIRNKITGAFDQWLRKRFPDGSKLKVRKTDIRNFINRDNQRIEEGADQLYEGWNTIKDQRVEIVDITETKATNQKGYKSKKSVIDEVFGNAKEVTVHVNDVNADINIRREIVDETYSHNKINSNAIEKTLKNVVKLLQESKYIGSHVDYSNENGNIHYFVTPVTINARDRVIMFAVHDVINNRGIKTAEKAYVAEIFLANENGAFSKTWAIRALSQDLHQHQHRMVSIGELIDNVNSDRIRSFDKNSLSKSKLNLTRLSTAEVSDSQVTQMYSELGEIRQEEQQLRAELKAQKPAYDAWVDRMSKAMEDGTVDELMPEYQEWEKGYTGISRRLQELDQRRRAKQQELEDYIEQRDVAAEQKAIAESGLTEEEYRRKQAVKEFGYTTNMSEAGYMLPNGKMLNFSGEKGRHSGYRGQDHRAIETIYASSKIERGGAMVKFMQDGNIRMMPESPGVDISSKVEPTKEQYNGIRRMAQQFAEDEYFTIDFTDENGNVVDSLEYEGRISPDRIIRDIKTFYETGAAPQQSIVSQFHYSMADANMDVDNWMMNQSPSTLMTEGERQLVNAYRGLKTKIELTEKRIRDYDKEISRLEEKREMQINLSPEERDTLTQLKNRREIQQAKLERFREELTEITSSGGYADMMMKSSKFLRQHVEGRTQAQVEAAVDSMTNEAERAAKEIEESEKKLRRMAEETGVKTVRQALGTRGLKETAAYLRSNYNTSMTQSELEARVAGIVLKELNGEDVTEDIRELATEVANTVVDQSAAEDVSEAISEVRGRTILISPALQKEMRARNMTLKDIRQRTKGSGVKFEYANPGQVGTLSGSNAGEIENEIAGLRGKLTENELDAIDNFVEYVEGLLKAKRGNAADYGFNEDDVNIFIRSMVNVMLDENNNGGMTREQLQARIRKEMGIVGKALQAVTAAKESAQSLNMSGLRARGALSFQQRDVAAAMDYYNQVARQAAEVERQRIRRDVIEKLRAENTRALIEKEQHYKELMKNDRRARQLRDDNETLRHQIATNIGRFRRYLTQETDQKNIPEETKALARFVSKMLVNHDTVFRKVTYMNQKELADFGDRLLKMDLNDGEFEADRDLDWLVIHAQNEADSDYSAQDAVLKALQDIESGLMEYRNAEGRAVMSLVDRKAALTKVSEAVATIYSVIKARSEAEIAGRKMLVLELAEELEDDMQRSRFKGERTGKLGKLVGSAVKSLTYGNMTPEYFIKNLRNRAMEILHSGMHEAEQRSGLEAAKAKQRIAQIAEETGYATWDGQETHQVETKMGTVTMTTEQIMALYATWLRENNALRPEETSHLLRGGFVLAQGDRTKGLYGREKTAQRPIRMSKDQLNALGEQLTPQQREYVEAIVEYMSSDLAQLGNEASLRMFGIKKFTEKFYFPIKSWGGVLNKSSASGVNNQNDNRATRQSFSKRITAGANNAVEISDFTPTAIKHVVGMITYNTVGPAVENINKVLNQQLQYGELRENEETGEVEDTTYKRNLRAAFQEAYGKDAYDYLVTFMQDVNGGVTQQAVSSMREKLLSMFKKNAVAGSLSVAAQQPLSYIRAAMMINPKYLAQALSPQYWKGSFAQMMKYSGIAVIKDMGKFDMNYGRSMIDYITPEGKQTKAQAAWQKTTDAATSLPQKMDAMTWTRLWTACKLELAAQNPGVDMNSEAFLKKVAERFNDVMRRTQVYDSVMVKSQNMRSTHYLKKVATSFMAEPTLSLNVLADAMINVKEAGGKQNLWKALATFVLSAAAQAGAKAFFGAGRSPDKKKTREENFLNKFGYNLLSEVNPLGLIPGYSQIMEVLINGELTDDAMGMIGKAVEVRDKIFSMATGQIGKKGLYRDLEDSIGQLLQLATDIPAKNFMRDFRAMVNWFSNGTALQFTGDMYDQRATKGSVLKYQFIDTLVSQDLIGLINKRLGDAGYGTTAKAYEERIYRAKKAGDTAAVKDMSDYVTTVKLGGDDPEKTLQSALNSMAKKDDSLSAKEKADFVIEGSTEKAGHNYIIKMIKEGSLTRDEAMELMKKTDPTKSADEIWWSVDRAMYEKETGKDVDSKSFYHRLDDAVNSNKAAEIEKTVKQLLEHGVAKDKIANKMSDWKKEYLAADDKGKVKIRNAIQLVYKALSMTADDADKKINKWKEDKKETKKP